MKEGKDIVCLTMTTWEGDYMKTIVHMMSQLAKNHRVLFVDYPFTWKDVATSALGKSNAPVKRMLGTNKRLRTLQTRHGEVYHLTLPPTLPINWISNQKIYQTLNDLQSNLIKASITNAMDQLGFESPIVINAFNPLIGLPLAGKLGESKLIYYCYDEIRAAEWCGKHGGSLEDEFLKKVDKVIVTSEGLLESKSKTHSDVTLVKNGVDFDLFHQAFNPEKKQKKVIGYVGSIDFRLDYELLETLIRSFPHCDFHFVGRITEPLKQKRLDLHENVTFMGAKQPNEIPQYLSEFDVGIIPFAKNEFTKNIYPLKINEYLAAGLPVVSTDFAPLSDFEEFVSIATEADAFTQKLQDELTLDTVNLAQLRIAMAKKNDWSARATQVEELLKDQDDE